MVSEIYLIFFNDMDCLVTCIRVCVLQHQAFRVSLCEFCAKGTEFLILWILRFEKI